MTELDRRARIATALRAHSTKLRRYVASRVPSDVVDDICQAAALRSVEKAATLRDPERVLPWLYRIHANAANDALRRLAADRRLLEAVEREVDPIEVPAEPVCGCSVAQTRQLSANYASILELVDICGMSLAEAAQALGISVNNATVRLHRARAALKKQLLEHCGVTSVNACAECRCVFDGCCAA
ncbi:MAG: sigma-70 family RNA polymerase sigma factor [Pseudomonadota bacterium]